LGHIKEKPCYWGDRAPQQSQRSSAALFLEAPVMLRTEGRTGGSAIIYEKCTLPSSLDY